MSAKHSAGEELVVTEEDIKSILADLRQAHAAAAAADDGGAQGHAPQPPSQEGF
jgi:hypothetical protein